MVDVTTPVQVRGPMGHALEISLATLLSADKAASRAAIGAEGPGDLAAVAVSGAYADLGGKPTLGTAAGQASSAFATAAQGGKADTALQPIVAGAGIGAGGFAKHALVDGGAAGDIAVAAIKTGDELNEVLQHVYTAGAVTDIVDLTAEFTIKAGNGVINNTSGTDSTGNKLLVRWTKKTA